MLARLGRERNRCSSQKLWAFLISREVTGGRTAGKIQRDRNHGPNNAALVVNRAQQEVGAGRRFPGNSGKGDGGTARGLALRQLCCTPHSFM